MHLIENFMKKIQGIKFIQNLYFKEYKYSTLSYIHADASKTTNMCLIIDLSKFKCKIREKLAGK